MIIEMSLKKNFKRYTYFGKTFSDGYDHNDRYDYQWDSNHRKMYQGS